MGFLIGLFTLVMVVDCLILIFLVLIQLPKKESGAGLAFGGGATDALFGAGAGNVLTKATKYAAIVFFGLAVLLALMQSNYHRRHATEFEQELRSPSRLPGMETPAAPAPSAAAPKPLAPLATGSNAVAAPANPVTPLAATNAPAATNK